MNPSLASVEDGGVVVKNKMIRNEELIRDKLKFYKDRGDSVHLTLIPDYMSDRPFRNGEVVKINEDNIEFDDEKLGTILIYLHQIRGVMKREAKR